LISDVPGGVHSAGDFLFGQTRSIAQGGGESESTDFVQLAALQGSSGRSRTLLQDSAPKSPASRPRRGGLRRRGDGTIDHKFHRRAFIPADAAAVIVGWRVARPPI